MSTPGVLPTGGGYRGQEWLQTGGTAYNAIAFLVRQIVAGKAFAALVEVKAVTGGGVAAPPVVSVRPLVNQVDGFGNQVSHGTIYNLPCFRLQGGLGAVILDPVVGDIGMAVCCDRDISIVKATGAVSGPGSRRQNDWADGCYFGAFLGSTPTQYVQFLSTGVNMVDLNGNSIAMGPGGVTITSVGTLTVDAANSKFNGNITATGTITP